MERRKAFYQEAVNYLLALDGVSKDVLDRHLTPVFNKPKDLSLVYFKLCESAQNRQMSSKVIGNAINGGIQSLGLVLFEFDPSQVAEKYSKSSKTELLDKIVADLKPSGQIRDTPRALWPQYCQSVIDSAHFLNSFHDVEDFYEWADFFANDTRAKAGLPLMISYEITGIGFSLACDFLKELGYVEFGKPDVHIKDIFKALSFIDPNERNSAKSDFQAFKVIDDIAQENGVNSYTVDKVLWLIGSGNFYLSDINVGSCKKDFIKVIKERL